MEPDPPSEAPPPPPAKPRRRLRRILIWTGSSLGVLALTVLVAGPTVIAAVIRSRIAAAVAEKLDATTEIGSVSFSWSGRIALRDLAIRDRAGATVASVKSIDADVALFSAIRGRIIAKVLVDRPRIELRRGTDGKLNVDTLPKAAPEPPAATPKKGEPPILQVKLTVTGGIVAIEGNELTNLTVNVIMDSPRKPTSFDASIETPGSGRVRAAGDLSMTGTGHLGIGIENLPLAPFAPVAHVKSLEGLVNGDLEYLIVAADKITGGGEVRITGLAVDAAKVPDVRILQAFGDKPSIIVQAGEALVLEARGNLPFEGSFTASSKLGPLSELAAAFLPFKPGSRIEGTASARGTFAMTSALSVQVAEMSAKIRGADVRGSASLEGSKLAFKVDAEISPDEMRPVLDLPVTGPRLTLRVEGTDRSARGLVTSPLLKVRDVEQRNIKVEFDVALTDSGFEVRALEARSDTFTATAKGFVRGTEADLTFSSEGDIAGIAAIGGLDAKGKVTARGSMKGTTGTAAVGLQSFTMTGLAATGSIDAKFDGGKLTAGGKVGVNEGTASLKIEADLRAAQGAVKPSSTFELTFDKVRANQQMGPILQLLHPAFAVAGDAAGRLDGRIDTSVSIRYDGAVTPELLSGGWDRFPKAGLSGGGKFEIHDCTVNGSALLGELFGSLAGERREVKMHPIEFRIAAGRVTYDRPWPWTISGSDTTFTGSIGLDRTLDMVWHIPVTDELAARVPALKHSKGKTLDAPLGGTVEKPRLGWKEVVGKVAGDRVEEAAKKGLEDLLGGRDEKKAKKLLEEADALHGEGKKAEAAAKYRKIKDDCGRTRVYKDNRERIDAGAEGR
ncbi:MAG TPA: hypothetical protein VGK61_07510 [Planctomycetota bacterium]